jgi:dihydroorotate dehydrogenase (NAD+) catalytic subunit
VAVSPARLELDCLGLRFANPVLTASGTFGYGEELSSCCPLAALGGIVTKGISLEPRAGNPAPRICETAAGMLNSIGLANVGLRAFVAEKLPFLRECGTRVLVNFFGETEDEYLRCAAGLSGHGPGIDALEMNISCPNVKSGGLEFGVDPEVAGRLVERVRGATDLPLVVKLTPNVSDVVALARACVQGGASALSLINTLRGMAIDPRTRRPRLARVFGGLSGPAIKPVALRMVHEVARAKLGVPIIGIGGIACGEDAAEFLLAGATLVQVGTASFVRPDAAARVAQELQVFCDAQRVARVEELVGALGSDPPGAPADREGGRR